MGLFSEEGGNKWRKTWDFTSTKTWPPVPLLGFPWNPLALIVVVELKSGLKNDISGKKGEDSRYCCVAGTGYNPAK